MTTLDIARQGKAAARQIEAQLDAGVLTDAELRRLLGKIRDGFEQMMPSAPPPKLQTERRGPFLIVRNSVPL